MTTDRDSQRQLFIDKLSLSCVQDLQVTRLAQMQQQADERERALKLQQQEQQRALDTLKLEQQQHEQEVAHVASQLEVEKEAFHSRCAQAKKVLEEADAKTVAMVAREQQVQQAEMRVEQVKHKEAHMDDREAKLQRAQAEFTQSLLEHAQQSALVKHKEEQIQQAEARLAAEHEKHDERDTMLEVKARELRTVEDSAQQTLAQAAADASNVRLAEERVAAAEQRLLRASAEADQREANLKQHSQRCIDQEALLLAREEKLKVQELTAGQQRQRALQEQEQEVAQREASLAIKEQQLKATALQASKDRQDAAASVAMAQGQHSALETARRESEQRVQVPSLTPTLEVKA